MRSWQRPFIDLERLFYRTVELIGQRLDSGLSDNATIEDPLASPVDHTAD